MNRYPHRYRDQPILKSAIEFARAGQCRAVSAVLQSYGSVLKNYHLAIISNFPESVSPDEYFDLFPRVDNFGKVILPDPAAAVGDYYQEEFAPRQDWLEYDFIKR